MTGMKLQEVGSSGMALCLPLRDMSARSLPPCLKCLAALSACSLLALLHSSLHQQQKQRSHERRLLPISSHNLQTCGGITCMEEGRKSKNASHLLCLWRETYLLCSGQAYGRSVAWA